MTYLCSRGGGGGGGGGSGEGGRGEGPLLPDEIQLLLLILNCRQQILDINMAITVVLLPLLVHFGQLQTHLSENPCKNLINTTENIMYNLNNILLRFLYWNFKTIEHDF